MRAALILEHGDRNNVVVGEYPKPEAGPKEVVVKVEAVSLNHLDIFVRRGIPGRKLPAAYLWRGHLWNCGTGRRRSSKCQAW